MNNHSIRDRVQHHTRQQVLDRLREGVAQGPQNQARWQGWPELNLLEIEAEIHAQLSQHIHNTYKGTPNADRIPRETTD
jgi:hypothetical protein